MTKSSSSDSAAFGQPRDRSPIGPEHGDKRWRYGVAVFLLTTAIMATVLGACLFPAAEEPEEAPPIPSTGAERPLSEVSTRAFRAELLWQIPLARWDAGGNLTPESASLPPDVAVIDGRFYVLDSGNSRILEVDQGGNVLQALHSDSGLGLRAPMAITAHEGKLYVANSGGGNIIVLDSQGAVERVITPQVTSAERPLRPIGIAIAPNGHIFLSDPDNHRVLHLDAEGRLVTILGSGKRDSGEYGFNTPGGLSLDGQGNLYVVDMLNYTVKKYSPSGQFLLSVGEAGDTEGTFSRPKAVAVDTKGRIFVSDTLLVAVEVFGSDGLYLGFIGRKTPEDQESNPLFQAPHGLKVSGDTLYVVDRFAGILAFRLQG